MTPREINFKIAKIKFPNQIFLFYNGNSGIFFEDRMLRGFNWVESAADALSLFKEMPLGSRLQKNITEDGDECYDFSLMYKSIYVLNVPTVELAICKAWIIWKETQRCDL